MLNLKVRLRQKWFWITLIPLLFLLFDQVTQLFELVLALSVADGPLYDGEIMALCLEIVGVVFAVLALVGFPVDLTTDGYGDSARALNYEVPAMNASETGKAVCSDLLDNAIKERIEEEKKGVIDEA